MSSPVRNKKKVKPSLLGRTTMEGKHFFNLKIVVLVFAFFFYYKEENGWPVARVFILVINLSNQTADRLTTN